MIDFFEIKMARIMTLPYLHHITHTQLKDLYYDPFLICHKRFGASSVPSLGHPEYERELRLNTCHEQVL